MGYHEAGICPVPHYLAVNPSGKPCQTGSLCQRNKTDADGGGLESLLSIKSLPEPEIRVNVTSTDVELHQVHFSYSGNAEDEVLHGIDLKLPQGSPV